MSYQVKFEGWESIAIEGRVMAYRKTKAGCFFENTFPTTIKFAEYEKGLTG